GFAVGSFCLGALVGGLMGGSVQNMYGRRRTMFISNIFFIIGAVLLGLTYHQAQFIVGRIVIGFACGLGGVVAPTYLGEISTIKGRGTMGTMYQLLIVVGILISNLLGLGLSAGHKWRILLAINGVPALIQLFLLPSLAESPRYLVSKNRLEEARSSLQRLRGPNSNIEVEFSDIVQLLLGHQSNSAAGVGATAVNTQDSAFEEANLQKNETEVPVTATATGSPHSYSIARLFTTECRGLAVIGILVHFFQQASGINGLIYYSTSFLSNVFGGNNSKYITVGVSICNLLSTLASVFLIDKTGRRTLLLISAGGVALSSVLLVIGAYADVGVLVVVSVF
ncbi:hypothetical protein BGZ68_003344, partial [Mortierella alpina]